MNPGAADFKNLCQDICSQLESEEPNCEVLICPPFPYIVSMLETAKGSALQIGAQNAYFEQKGAYTGEVSPQMLSDLSVNYVILGHSERRKYFGETDAFLRLKVDAALEVGLPVIFCCGESLEERESDSQAEVVGKQLRKALFHLSEESFAKVVIAYEPVWAIGTGKTASPQQAQEMHEFIRTLLSKNVSQKTAEACRILYGGSMKPANAAELLSQKDVDGGLIGGASLKANDFLAIVKTAG